jgi:hypothetical protein
MCLQQSLVSSLSVCSSLASLLGCYGAPLADDRLARCLAKQTAASFVESGPRAPPSRCVFAQVCWTFCVSLLCVALRMLRSLRDKLKSSDDDPEKLILDFCHDIPVPVWRTGTSPEERVCRFALTYRSPRRTRPHPSFGSLSVGRHDLLLPLPRQVQKQSLPQLPALVRLSAPCLSFHPHSPCFLLAVASCFARRARANVSLLLLLFVTANASLIRCLADHVPQKFNLKNNRGPCRVCISCRDWCVNLKFKAENGEQARIAGETRAQLSVPRAHAWREPFALCYVAGEREDGHVSFRAHVEILSATMGGPSCLQVSTSMGGQECVR